MKRMATILGLAASLAAGVGGAGAQEQVNPFWARVADPDLASSLYPGFAAMLGESGRVTLRCQIEDDGPPYLCDVVDEAPHGLGFGAAARVLLTSAEVGAARIDGEVVPRSIRTMVRFRMEDHSTNLCRWVGSEPTPSRLKLAREMVDELIETGRTPPSPRDGMLGGLDYDRRQIVSTWIDELFPRDEAAEKEALTFQLARLYDEDALRRIRAGEEVEESSKEVSDEPCPDPSPADLAAREELRRRYCDRYECDVDPFVTDG